jgi:hypothetical protein
MVVRVGPWVVLSHTRAHVTLRRISNTGHPPNGVDRQVRNRRQPATGEPSPADAPPKLFSRAIILMKALMPARVDEMRLDHALPVVALLLVFIAGAITSFLNPQSGVQDRMARTKVVAR